MIKKDLITKCFIFLWVFSFPCFAQYQYDDQEAPNYSLADQTKNDMMVIIAAGVGGAILGLSTLSFVDEPGDHYDNVLTGGAIGLIAGVLYIAYRQAYGPSGIFAYEEIENKKLDFHSKNLVSSATISSPLAFQWTWRFD